MPSPEFLKAKFKSLEDAMGDLAIQREERLHFIFGDAANDLELANNTKPNFNDLKIL